MGLTNLGFAAAADLVGDITTIAAFTYLANGSDDTTAAATDTALGTENSGGGTDRVAGTISAATTSVADDTLQLATTWTITGTKTINEVGVFNASSDGTMIARSITAATRNVASGDSYQTTYKIQFS